MATLKEIKDRKATVQSINKITSALKLVSTAKSKKLLRDLKQFEPFYEQMFSMMEILNAKARNNSKLSTPRSKDIWIIFSSDMGLAGGFNNLLIKEFIKNYKKSDKVIVFGMKGKQLINSRMKNKVDYDFETYDLSQFNEIVEKEFVQKILKSVLEDDFNLKIIANHYLNQISNTINLVEVIPVNQEKMAKHKQENESLRQVMLFEPVIEELIDDLLKFYVESILNYHYRDSLAAEESARRNAMENATTNSDDMIKELSKQFNRIRQSKITQEISELVSGT